MNLTCSRGTRLEVNIDLPCRECIVVPMCSELCPSIIDMKTEIIKQVRSRLGICLLCGVGTIIGHHNSNSWIEVYCPVCYERLRFRLPKLLQKWEWNI